MLSGRRGGRLAAVWRDSARTSPCLYSRKYSNSMPNVRSKGRETVGGLSEAPESEDSKLDDSCDS
jgi:hypothetical protein